MKGVPGTPTPRSPVSNLPEFKVELPEDSSRDEQFGGCRSVERYERLDQIGEGTYGQVYLARDRETGEMVALKKIRMENEKEGFPITAIREIKLLKLLNHENVIRLKEIVRSQAHAVNQMKGSIYMVFDYMDHDLTGLLERRNYKLSLPQIKCYVMQLLQGLNYCHKQGVLHRDLKAANLLINNKGQLKLADFGLARSFTDDERKNFTVRVITLWYRPLELMMGKTAYSSEVDMWSVGCILAELLIGKALFTGKDEPEQCDRIMRLCGSPKEENMPGCSSLPGHYLMKKEHPNILRRHLELQKLTPAAVDLLCKLLVLNPDHRLSAIEAYQHEFFWKEAPEACKPEDLPRYDASHEMDMKKRKRNANTANAHPVNNGPVRGGVQGQGQGAHPMQNHQNDAKRQRYNGGPAGPQPMHPPSSYNHGPAQYGGARPGPSRGPSANMPPPNRAYNQGPAMHQQPAGPRAADSGMYPPQQQQYQHSATPRGGYGGASGHHGGQAVYDGYSRDGYSSGAYGGHYGAAPNYQALHVQQDYGRGGGYNVHQTSGQDYNNGYQQQSYAMQRPGYADPAARDSYGETRAHGHMHGSNARPPTYQSRR